MKIFNDKIVKHKITYETKKKLSSLNPCVLTKISNGKIAIFRFCWWE